jgi:hypothetical protein
MGPSVLALINYPEVVKMLSDDVSWCQDLGNAVLDQQDDVLKAIQAARGSASDAGYLQSNDQVTVVNEGDNITVESSDPEVIYVPQYDPAPVVNNNYTSYPPPYYSDPYPPYWAPAATFFTGMVVGAAFSYGFDWDNGDIDIDNDINIDNSRGDVNVDRGDRTNIDKTKAQDANGERKAGSTDKMGNGPARRPARHHPPPGRHRPPSGPDSANIQKQLGQGWIRSTPRHNQKLRTTRRRATRAAGNQSLKQNNKSTAAAPGNNASKQQVKSQRQRQKPQRSSGKRRRNRTRAAALAGQETSASNSKTRAESGVTGPRAAAEAGRATSVE